MAEFPAVRFPESDSMSIGSFLLPAAMLLAPVASGGRAMGSDGLADSASPSRPDADHELSRAAAACVLPLALEALRSGADPNLPQTALDITPLMRAALGGCRPVARALLDLPGIEVNARNKAGETALSYAVRSGNAALVQDLLERRANANLGGFASGPPLIWASYAGRDDLIRLLLEHRADIRAEYGGLRFSPLHMTLFQCKTQALESLIRHGAEINARDRDGETVLMHAVEKCPAGAEILLRQNGLDAAARSAGGKSALELALSLYPKGHPLIRMLLERGSARGR